MISWDDAETLQRSSSALCRFVVSLVALPPLLGGSCALWARRWKTEIRLGQTFGQLRSQGALLAGSALASALLLLPQHTASQQRKRRKKGSRGTRSKGSFLRINYPHWAIFTGFARPLLCRVLSKVVYFDDFGVPTCFIIHSVMLCNYEYHLPAVANAWDAWVTL